MKVIDRIYQYRVFDFRRVSLAPMLLVNYLVLLG